MSHPLFELANDRAVRQAAEFRDKAAELTGESLSASFAAERSGAPRLSEAGRSYFVKRSGKPATERRKNKEEEHLGAALVRSCLEVGSGIALPEEIGELRILDYQVRVKTGPVDEAATKGIGRIDLLGIGPDDRLAVVKLRYVEPAATRCRVGDTPLRMLLEGLGYTAIAAANRDEIAKEIAERFGHTVSDEPPHCMLLASPRYWELCRKRAVQKGATWIKELERLAQEVGESLSVPVHFLSLALEGDLGWSYAEDGPKLDGSPRIKTSWEPGAGRVRPKPKPRSKPRSDPADAIVEADLSRPVRAYAFAESYTAGDRIDHPKLGTGVVQGVAGPGKIRVLFDERKSVLVHERSA